MNQVSLLSGAANHGAEVLTMTSREIAALTGKEHSNVMRDIRNLLEQLQASNLNSACKSGTYEGVNGQQYQQYLLDKDTTLTLLLGYDAVARMKVVRRWQELEQAATAPVDSALAQDPEVQRLVMLRDTGVLSQANCEIAAFRLLGLIHPREQQMQAEPAPVAPQAEPETAGRLPDFLRIVRVRTRSGMRIKPRQKFLGKPTPVELNDLGRDFLAVNDDLECTARKLERYVVGGYLELRRGMYEYDIDTLTGLSSVNGARFVAGQRSVNGAAVWKAQMLLRHIAGLK